MRQTKLSNETDVTTPIDTGQADMVPVKFVTLHQPVVIPGKFTVEKTLNPDKAKGFKMFYYLGKCVKMVNEKERITAYIPDANVALCIAE